MFFDQTLARGRWVACFDLLGTRDLLAKGREKEVFEAYSDALDKLSRDGSLATGTRYAWFSDTFLIVTADDSPISFTEIDLLARSFSFFLLRRRVPFRGAIACRQMYADFENGVYLGSGMVEAYEYADGQDWVGLVLCPSAMSRMVSFGLELDGRLNWQPFPVPWTTRPKGCPDQVLAHILGQSFQVNGRNQCQEALREMLLALDAGDERVRRKYLRSLDFIESSRRVSVKNG